MPLESSRYRINSSQFREEYKGTIVKELLLRHQQTGLLDLSGKGLTTTILDIGHTSGFFLRDIRKTFREGVCLEVLKRPFEEVIRNEDAEDPYDSTHIQDPKKWLSAMMSSSVDYFDVVILNDIMEIYAKTDILDLLALSCAVSNLCIVINSGFSGGRDGGSVREGHADHGYPPSFMVKQGFQIIHWPVSKNHNLSVYSRVNATP